MFSFPFVNGANGLPPLHVPRVPKLDADIEAASTESASNFDPAHLNYWEVTYRDVYTSDGNLIGNTVGREGRSIQCWINYWISSRNTLQFFYRHNTVNPEFVPQGGAWQDYGLRHEISLRSGLYAKSLLQYEHISRYPILFSGSRGNIVAGVELGFVPHKGK